MMQTQLKTKPVAEIGEDIGLELGNQLVKAFAVANPNEVQSYTIGRNIIDQILAQPGCVGIRFYNAINENGEKTLVYLGIDQSGKAIIQLTSVNRLGSIQTEKGIIADRAKPPDARPSGPKTGIDADDFEWQID